MKQGIFGEALHNLAQMEVEGNADDFVIINMRPGVKTAAMLEVLSMIQKKSPAAIISDALSMHISHHAMSSSIYADAIIKAANKANESSIHQKGSALSILIDNGLLKKINPFVSQFKLK